MKTIRKHASGQFVVCVCVLFALALRSRADITSNNCHIALSLSNFCFLRKRRKRGRRREKTRTQRVTQPPIPLSEHPCESAAIIFRPGFFQQTPTARWCGGKGCPFRCKIFQNNKYKKLFPTYQNGVEVECEIKTRARLLRVCPLWPPSSKTYHKSVPLQTTPKEMLHPTQNGSVKYGLFHSGDRWSSGKGNFVYRASWRDQRKTKNIAPTQPTLWLWFHSLAMSWAVFCCCQARCCAASRGLKIASLLRPSRETTRCAVLLRFSESPAVQPNGMVYDFRTPLVRGSARRTENRLRECVLQPVP